MKKDYKTNCHQKYRLRYHIIFSTKYRRKCLNEIKEEIYLVFKNSEEKSSYEILELGVDADHIHLFISCKPTYSVGQIIRRLKSFSTNELWKSCDSHLKKFYWGDKKILWTHGYFCESIGNKEEQKIVEYIRNQGNPVSYAKLKI